MEREASQEAAVVTQVEMILTWTRVVMVETGDMVGNTCNAEPTGFADQMAIGCDKKSGIKDDFKDFA